jgi:ech hydrogenase subunit D
MASQTEEILHKRLKQMKKIKVTLDIVAQEIDIFYDYKTWHFLTINGVSLSEDRLEIQWIFSKYEAMDEIVMFYAECGYRDVIPSIVESVPSAIISQRELVDMFGVEVEGSEKGLYLDDDSKSAPLSGCSI